MDSNEEGSNNQDKNAYFIVKSLNVFLHRVNELSLVLLNCSTDLMISNFRSEFSPISAYTYLRPDE